MHPITPVHYLALSAALLLIGTIGVLTRRNIVIILMSIELILNAVNINLIAFSQYHQNVGGQIFTIFVITDAVAEAAVGLGILIALFRNKETGQADQIDLLKWGDRKSTRLNSSHSQKSYSVFCLHKNNDHN